MNFGRNIHFNAVCYQCIVSGKTLDQSVTRDKIGSNRIARAYLSLWLDRTFSNRVKVHGPNTGIFTIAVHDNLIRGFSQ